MCLVPQSCPALYDLMDCSPPGSSVHGFSRQDYWNELSVPAPEDLPDAGMKTVSPALTGRFFSTEPPGKLIVVYITYLLKKIHLYVELTESPVNRLNKFL